MIMNKTITNKRLDYDSCYHGHAQDLQVNDIFIHNEGHQWKVIKVPEPFPTGAIYQVNAKRITGYPKIKQFNFGRFVSL